MSVNINVSVSELRRFSDYISAFKKNIDGDCSELESAAKALSSTVSADIYATISNMIKQINDILINEGPALDDLKAKVDNYADFVERLKAVYGNT